MIDRESEKPPRIHPRLKAAPKIRQLLWCDFPRDAQLPEMWKTRPVVVVSFRNTLHGIATVVPCTSKQPTDLGWAVRLGQTIDGGPSWALCNHVATVAVSRLALPGGRLVRLESRSFASIVFALHSWLPAIENLDNPDQ
jgi:mRNA interferase MazF